MKKKFTLLTALLVIALTSLAIPHAQAIVIFDNFGAGDTYATSIGWTIGGPDQYFQQGEGFTPVGNDYILDTIELAVGLQSGTNKLEVWLMSDAAGEPGTVIETFSFIGAMGSFGSANPLLLGNSVLNPLLSAGTQYWLIASAPETDTWAAWNWNSIGDTGPHASRQDLDLDPWVVSNSTRGAFRISGTPVPEPSTLLLLGSGLVGLGVFRKKFSKK